MGELKAPEVHGVFGRILVLDVDERTLIRLEQVLEEAGFDTTTTWDISEALLLLERACFDLIVVGDHPPEIDAYGMLCQPQSVARDVRCIVMRSVRPLPAGLRLSPAVTSLPGCSSDDILEQVHRQLGRPDVKADGRFAKWGPMTSNDRPSVQARKA